jgi:hypothetical protein
MTKIEVKLYLLIEVVDISQLVPGIQKMKRKMKATKTKMKMNATSACSH